MGNMKEKVNAGKTSKDVVLSARKVKALLKVLRKGVVSFSSELCVNQPQAQTLVQVASTLCDQYLKPTPRKPLGRKRELMWVRWEVRRLPTKEAQPLTWVFQADHSGSEVGDREAALAFLKGCRSGDTPFKYKLVKISRYKLLPFTKIAGWRQYREVNRLCGSSNGVWGEVLYRAEYARNAWHWAAYDGSFRRNGVADSLVLAMEAVEEVLATAGYRPSKTYKAS